jgi:hypothetical protein
VQSYTKSGRFASIIRSDIYQQPTEAKPMKVFLIDPHDKQVIELEIAETRLALQDLIGFETIDFDEIDSNGDCLFFDEECFIRQQVNVGKFKVDNLAPIAGKGVIVNSPDNGQTLSTPKINLSDLIKRVTFL